MQWWRRSNEVGERKPLLIYRSQNVGGCNACKDRGSIGRWSWPEDLNINQIEKSVSLDHTRPCISTSNQNTKRHVCITFNLQSYTNMYVHNLIGTGSCTTSTTNMYDNYFTYPHLARQWYSRPLLPNPTNVSILSTCNLGRSSSVAVCWRKTFLGFPWRPTCKNDALYLKIKTLPENQ